MKYKMKVKIELQRYEEGRSEKKNADEILKEERLIVVWKRDYAHFLSNISSKKIGKIRSNKGFITLS